MSQEILTALAQLDVGNDEHWTSDGLPRMDKVHALAGNTTLTRQQVTAVQPGFSRATAGTIGANAAGTTVATTPWVQGSGTDAASAAPAGTQAPTATELDELEAEDGEPDLLNQLSVAQAALDKLEEIKIKAVQAVLAQQAKVDALITQAEKEGAQETTGQAIQGYLARQRQVLVERGERLALLKESGINLKELSRNLRSPLDSAMTRRTERGTQRPGS